MTATKTSIRPVITGIDLLTDSSPEEHFQHTVLRPVIKLQHDLLIAFFEHYLTRKKTDFAALSALQKQAIISAVFKNDISFKTEVKGMITGLFTPAEYTAYLHMAGGINKRIWAITAERLLSVLV